MESASHFLRISLVIPGGIWHSTQATFLWVEVLPRFKVGRHHVAGCAELGLAGGGIDKRQEAAKNTTR